MNKIKFTDVKIKDGFWKKKQDMVKNSTVRAVYERFCETQRFSALECKWKESDKTNPPHIFWDSDTAKWIEGAAYIIEEKRNAELEKIIDEAVDNIVSNADENGYFNSHFLVTEQDKRFTDRDCHELYCAGHLIEGAIAYYNATGKDKFLKAMCKYADYIEKVFVKEQSAEFTTPGHPELELALIKLYEATGEERYFRMAEFFIDNHGNNDKDTPIMKEKRYNQDEMPIKNRATAEGHGVRAMYLMSAAADVAEKRNDEELKNACRRVFDNVVNKRMYITGGIGSTQIGEAFTVDYDLPNRTAYAETCAAISLAMFAGRMQRVDADSKYADIVERVLYNAILSGISMDGTSFFYVNPLEIDLDFNDVDTATKEKRYMPITERVKVFSCSCCPPNLVRFIPSVAEYMYTYDDETLYVHQYAESDAEIDGEKISQYTAYPENGAVKIKYNGKKKLAVRIPGWCKNYSINAKYEVKNGYAYIEKADEFSIEFDMPVRFIQANRQVHENAGRVAVMRGPVVYCAEGIDNGKDLTNAKIDICGECFEEKSEFILPQIKMTAFRDKQSDELYFDANNEYETSELTLIPYYAFANRGSSDMQVWFLKK